jgi:hypothetical protein
MRKFQSIATLCGDGLRPELQALFDRLAIDPHSTLFIRHDGMTQSGPDPVSEGKRRERPYQAGRSKHSVNDASSMKFSGSTLPRQPCETLFDDLDFLLKLPDRRTQVEHAVTS